MRQQHGFTLIEVMITVAIVAILAAVAFPSYTDYITRGRIADGLSQLADARTRMEQYFQDNRTYVNAPTCTAPPKPKGFQTFTCAATATTFTITAASDTSLGAAGDYTYTINQAGARGTTAFKGGTPTCTNGWQTKKGETC
jgi:type IV pilus assembly protein PilE